MAARYSSNYNKAYVTANGAVGRGEAGGRLKTLVDTYTLPGATLDLNDTIDLMKLPPYARVVEAQISCASLGTTGILSLGHRASVKPDGTAEVLDADAFIDSADAGGQAVTELMTANANLAGNMKQFGNQETQVYATCLEASTNTAVEIKFSVTYIID
jgi:hypothetical protein